MRAWVAGGILCLLAGFEIFLDAPRDLMLATLVAFLVCAAVFTLHMMRHMGWRTYDIVRFIIMGGLFVFIITRPYPTYILIIIYLAILIPLNLLYPDKTPGDNE